MRRKAEIQARMMRILIVGLNYAPEPIGIGPYTSRLAEYLHARGHDVEVITGNPYYPDWCLAAGYSSEGSTAVESGVTVYRVPHYIPENPTGLKRIAHHLSFARTARKALAEAQRPDLVLAIAPSLLAAPVALAAAKRFGARSWLHIQDFEVEAAIATGLLPEWLANLAGAKLERSIIRRFEWVSAISPAMVRKAKDKGANTLQLVELRNWAEESVHPQTHCAPDLRAAWGLSDAPIALYSGNLSLKQGAGLIAEAARLLNGQSDVQFVVCGAGNAKAQLEHAARDLPNLTIHDLVPRKSLGELLAMADMHLLPQIAGAADLVLPSKLTNMLASGRPVIATADTGTDLAEEVSDCGFVTPPDDARLFAEAIAKLAEDAPLRTELGKNAAVRAKQRWSAPVLLEQFALSLEQIVREPKTL